MFTIESAAVAITEYLAKSLKGNGSIKTFFNEFTDATVAWIKPIFLKEDGSEKKVTTDLIKNPDDKAIHEKVKTLIEAKAEDDDNALAILTEMAEIAVAKMGNTTVNTNTSTVTGNNNLVVQGVNNSQINIGNTKQTHSGSGDIISGDKITNNTYHGSRPIDTASGDVWKTMLSQGRIQAAIEHLLELHKTDSEKSNTLFVLSGQYNFNQSNLNKGMITNTESAVNRAKITNSLLEMFGKD